MDSGLGQATTTVQPSNNVQANESEVRTDNDTKQHPITLSNLLDSIRIVMVNTTLPANIGSAARAMHTMGLTDLVVVDPKLPIDESSESHAAGGKAILSNCQVVDNLDTAIAPCQLVFAASSRNRHIPRPVVTPTQSANLIIQFVQMQKLSDTYQPKIAVLFGREDRGLTNAELAKADYHIQIDANPEYPVLNVASAVQVIASFFYASFISNDSLNAQQYTENSDSNYDSNIDSNCDSNIENSIAVIQRQQWDASPINQQQKQHLLSQIIKLMAKLDLVDSENPDQLKELPNRLSRLLSRLQLDEKEHQLINSIIAKILIKK